MAQTSTDIVTGATTAALDTSGPADVAAATAFTPAGAPDQVTDFDLSHPAVDNDPRAGTTADQNRIDFNNPADAGVDVVSAALGMKTSDEAEKEAAAERAKQAKKDQAKA